LEKKVFYKLFIIVPGFNFRLSYIVPGFNFLLSYIVPGFNFQLTSRLCRESQGSLILGMMLTDVYYRIM